MAAALGTTLALALPPAALAQSHPQPPRTATQPAVAAFVPYLDPVVGYEMKLPPAWQYNRTRFPGPEGSIGVLRGNDPVGTHSFQVFVYREMTLPEFPTWVRQFEQRLGFESTGTRPASNPVEAARRAFFRIETEMAGQRTHTWYFCIPFDPNTIWVLMLAGEVDTPADEQELETLLNQVADSVRVLYDPAERARINEAFARGVQILEELHAASAAVEIDQEKLFLEMQLGGKPIGYIEQWTRRASEPQAPGSGRAVKNGLRVHEESWRFADDGTVRHTELDFFTSDDFQNELIESKTTQVPAADVPTQRLYIELEQCVREGNALVTSFSTNLDPTLPEPRPPIPIGPRYLDGAWVRLLPRLLLNPPREMYGFAVYDTQSRALSPYLVQLLGPTDVPSQPGEQGFVFEIRQGYVPQPARLYTDRHGRTVRLEAGELVLVAKNAADIERAYTARREPARARMTPRVVPLSP